MNAFPDTSTTLLAKLAERESGIDQAAWFRFFALYQPVMVEFARIKGAGEEAEDVVQDVFADLADAFQAGRYIRRKGRFRAYLAAMLRNALVSRFRRRQARPERDCVSLDETSPRSVALEPTASLAADDAVDWRLARHRAAVDHILNKTALSEQSRQIYRMLLETGETCAEVARKIGLPASTVRQVKSRVSRMILAFEKSLV